MALRYFHDNNTKALTDMGKAAGAFARQTGLSIDDALDMQADMMENKQMNAKTASENMQMIGASFRAMNNQLVDAGFKGSLLNVEKLAKWTKEAAESSESASFSAEGYAKSLAKMAKNARAFGMSARSADAFAKRYADAANSDDQYAQFQRGRGLDQMLTAKYGATAKTGDINKLVSELKEKDGLAQETAEQVASALIAKSRGKEGPLYLNRLAAMLEGSNVNNHAFDGVIMGYMERRKIDATDPTAINELVNDPQLLGMLGMQRGDKNAAAMIQGVWHKYQEEHGVKGTHVEKATPTILDKLLGKKGTTAKTDEQAIAEEAANQDAKGTGKNSLLEYAKATGAWQAIQQNPLIAGTKALGVGVGALALNGLGKSLTGKSLFGLMGAGLPKFGARAAESATEAALPGLVDNAGRAITRDATEGAARSAGTTTMRTLGKDAIKALARSRIGKFGVAAGLVAGGLGIHMFSKNNNEQQDTGYQNDPNKSVEENAALKAQFEAQNPTNTGLYTPPPTSASVGDAVMRAGVDTGLHFGGKAAGALATKGLTATAEKFGTAGVGKLAAKGAGMLAAKSAARAVPIIGTLLSAGITGATTDGPMGRKLMAALGDFGGTALGQLATGGIGGGIVGGAAGSLGGEKLYDKLFGGDNRDAVAKVAQAQNAIQQQQASAAQQAMQNVTGGNLGIASIGSFGAMRPDGTVPLTVNVTGLPKVVQQATSFNQSMQTQFSGARV